MKLTPSQRLWIAVFGPDTKTPSLREDRVLRLLESMHDPRGMHVLRMRYWENMGWQEVADSLPRVSGGTGVSRELVRRMHVRALRRLRHPSRRPLWEAAVREVASGE